VARPARPRRRRRAVAVVLLAVLAAVIAWPLGLLLWANGRIQHVPALSGTPDTTPGTTYLLAGSDVRGDEGGIPTDGTEGARTDTVMILHVPPSGPAALISLPRDTYTEIPGHGPAKLNAAYAWGGPTLLVQTVEGLTGLHVDHYAEVTLGGVARVVDAVGGVELCMDPEVNKVTFPVADPDSGMVWDAPGCRMQSGPEALAFARMRKADHEGDIGRGKRQQQLIASVARSVADPSLLWQPTRQVSLLRTGLGAFTVSEGTNILDLGRLALAFRAATGPGGVRGTPPIASLDYRPGGDVGSTVLLDPEATPAFWQAIVEGTLPPGPVGGISAG
jgi:LCP family protein required for cell wall assembly